jgi:large subunit ribosomal protein L10
MASQSTKHTVDKQGIIERLKTDIDKAVGVIFLDYTGLKVSEVETWRRRVRAAPGIGYRVVKNTLLKRALEGTPGADAAKFLKGTPTGVVIGFEDPQATAKLTYDFLKETEHLKIKGGLLDKKPLSAKDAEALAKMPSKREMLAQILGMILSPGSSVAGQIKSVGGKLVSQIDQLAEKGLDKKA